MEVCSRPGSAVTENRKLSCMIEKTEIHLVWDSASAPEDDAAGRIAASVRYVNEKVRRMIGRG